VNWDSSKLYIVPASTGAAALSPNIATISTPEYARNANQAGLVLDLLPWNDGFVKVSVDAGDDVIAGPLSVVTWAVVGGKAVSSRDAVGNRFIILSPARGRRMEKCMEISKGTGPTRLLHLVRDSELQHDPGVAVLGVDVEGGASNGHCSPSSATRPFSECRGLLVAIGWDSQRFLSVLCGGQSAGRQIASGYCGPRDRRRARQLNHRTWRRHRQYLRYAGRPASAYQALVGEQRHVRSEGTPTGVRNRLCRSIRNLFAVCPRPDS